MLLYIRCVLHLDLVLGLGKTFYPFSDSICHAMPWMALHGMLPRTLLLICMSGVTRDSFCAMPPQLFAFCHGRKREGEIENVPDEKEALYL